MPDENPTRVDAGDLWMAQRSIVLQLLRDDHPEQWTRQELEAEISGIPERTILAALVYLAIEEVVEVDEDGVRAAKCARYLDELGLVAL
jgi:hypothetical protein